MRWYNFFHIYQPPAWNEDIIRRVARESYQPILAILEKHGHLRITLHISGSLTEQLQALGLHSILDRIKQLVIGKQIELVGGAMYHPILPLLPTEEFRRQCELQHELHESVFGLRSPQGFYCPEMAYDPRLEKTLVDMGYAWVILDELCGGKPLGELDLSHPYISTGGLKYIFRNRLVSDWLSFRSDIHQPAASADVIANDGRSRVALVTAMDGENLGHHRHGVDRLWEELVTAPTVETAVLSDLAASASQNLQPRSGSWSSQYYELSADIPFGLWSHPRHPIHQSQWELTYLVMKTIQASKQDPYYPAARRLLDRALCSDRYWWASAQPWWDPVIVIRETQKLADAVSPLASTPVSTKKAIEELMTDITTTVTNWEGAGLAKQRQATYLQGSGDVRYMGGGRLS